MTRHPHSMVNGVACGNARTCLLRRNSSTHPRDLRHPTINGLKTQSSRVSWRRDFVARRQQARCYRASGPRFRGVRGFSLLGPWGFPFLSLARAIRSAGRGGALSSRLSFQMISTGVPSKPK